MPETTKVDYSLPSILIRLAVLGVGLLIARLCVGLFSSWILGDWCVSCVHVRRIYQNCVQETP